jgi:hypothetical protein
VELNSPEMNLNRSYNSVKENSGYYFSRASSAVKDPGVLGPIVWDLKKKKAVQGIN